MAVDFDTTTEFGARAERRLRNDQIGWLTTVSPNGMPQSTPVWFLWDGETFLIFSEPGTRKLRNIRDNPKVALHLDGDGKGGDIVVVNGDARIADRPSADQFAAYVAKYEQGIKGLGMTTDQLAQTYSTTIRMTPSRLTGH